MNKRISLFFFFQAEDGIRDPLVTGVQTCALPIFDDLDAAVGVLDLVGCAHERRILPDINEAARTAKTRVATTRRPTQVTVLERVSPARSTRSGTSTP